MTIDPYLEERAEERVMERNGFYLHLGFYLVVNLALFLTNIYLGGAFWFFYPLIGWGMAVILHALVTFIGQTRWMEAWRKRRVSSELHRLEQQRR